MRLATLDEGGPDGRLVLIDTAGEAFRRAQAAATLQVVMEDWSAIAPRLRDEADGPGEWTPLAGHRVRAPLPRAWQFLDGSAFLSHAELMSVAFKMAPGDMSRPLMYQGLSDHFLGAADDVPFPDEAHGIDFEGEFAVIVDAVPMGVTPQDALAHIRLVVQLNDWSLRTFGPVEMKTGFGFVHAKPASSMAPFAVSPDELGNAWRDGRVGMDLEVTWNGVRFGRPNGAQMAFGFHDLVAHAARTRRLVAGTVIGSGTVSNPNYREIGSTCISERRGIEVLDHGEAKTGFMRFGDRVTMQALAPDGAAPFGRIDQQVVAA